MCCIWSSVRVAIFLGFQASDKLERGMDIAARQKAISEAKAKAEKDKSSSRTSRDTKGQHPPLASSASAAFDPTSLINAPYVVDVFAPLAASCR